MRSLLLSRQAVEAPAAGPPRRRSPAFAFFCAYAFFVVYGTLLPFQFLRGDTALADRWNYVNWNPFMLVTGEATPIADVVTNVAFFVPLGFIGVHAQRRRSVWAAVGRCAIAGFLLSATVEVLQYFTPSRNPSTSDVLTNTAGAFLGALLAATFRRDVEAALARRATAWTARAPLLPVLAGYALVVVMVALVPFDFRWSVSELKRGVRAMQLALDGTTSQWVSAAVNGLRFAVLTGLAVHVLGRVRRGSRAAGVLGCLLGAGLLALGLEVAQILVRSHALAIRDLLAALIGATFGALVVVALEAWRRPHWGWGLVATGYGVGIVATALSPFEFRFEPGTMMARLTFTSLIPYSSYYYKANVAAVGDLLDGLLTWLPFAFVLARLRCRGRRPNLRSGLAVIGWSALLALWTEFLQLGVPRRYPEISDVLTAALGAALGAYAWSWCAHLAADLAAIHRSVIAPAWQPAARGDIVLPATPPALAGTPRV